MNFEYYERPTVDGTRRFLYRQADRNPQWDWGFHGVSPEDVKTAGLDAIALLKEYLGFQFHTPACSVELTEMTMVRKVAGVDFAMTATAPAAPIEPPKEESPEPISTSEDDDASSAT